MIGALVALVVVTAALVIADSAIRSYASERIASELRTAFKLAPTAPLRVDVQGFSALLQLAQQRLDRVVVRADTVTFDGLTGSAILTATGVPLDAAASVSRLSLEFGLNATRLRTLSASLSELKVSAVALADPNVVVTAPLSLLGLSVPVEVAIRPSAAAGALVLTPTTVSVAGIALPAEQLSRRFGAGATAALAGRTVCVAKYLPAVLSLSRAEVQNNKLVLTLAGTGVRLNATTLSAVGRCV